jgi:hypothetical protein
MGKKLETNKVFSQSDKIFIKSCQAIDIDVTTRQASKWRRQTGSAYKLGRPIHLIELKRKA